MYIHVYNGSQQISEGDGLNPLVIGPLNASENEVSAPVELTIKTDSGFKTFGTTTISFTGTTKAKWMISKTQSGSYTNSLEIADEITSTGTTFYVKAKATDDEAPSNDTSVDIAISTVIAAV